MKRPGMHMAVAYLALTVSALVATGGPADGFSSLTLFDTFVAKDSDASRIARNIAYGEANRQRLDIYRPKDDAAGLPVILFIYGGSWNSGRKGDYSFVGRALAASGFVTVIADYRLVPQIRYPAFVEDGAKAIAWIVRNIADYGGDPKRIFVAGHSAGAYNALMLAVEPRFLEAESVSHNVIKGAAGLSGPYDFLPLVTRTTRRTFGSTADLESTQPVNLVTRRTPPIFLAHGADDGLVRPDNTRALSARLAEKQIRAKTRIYPDVGHAGLVLGLARPFRESAPVLRDMTAFFNAL
ncbi:MAG: alpha/beta hydrolase [Pseudomonadota bacterium]